MGFWSFRPYVPVAKRREQAAQEVEKLKKKGRVIAPVLIEGRKIAHSVWGKAWCENLERYSDFESRLPRGRSYVRNGSIIDLQITRGRLSALVSGSEIYEVNIDIAVAAPARWKSICKDCAGSIGSLVELLQGKLSKNVMERVCREGDGLFPAPGEIRISCCCPDWADMCKHVAATLYGVAARLDAAPDLLFTLRGVDRTQLVATAGADFPMIQKQVASARLLSDDDVGALFGIDMTPSIVPSPAAAKKVEKAPDAAASITTRQTKPERRTKGATAPRAATEKKLAPATGKAAGNKASPPASPGVKPKDVTRGRVEAPAGRTKAARWIGAKARKARHES